MTHKFHGKNYDSKLKGGIVEVDNNNNVFINTNEVYVDHVNSRVGIGKIPVAERLEVNGNITVDFVILGNAPTQDMHAATKKYVDDAVALENLWDKVSPDTLVPHTPNDNVDIGSGDFITTGHISDGVNQSTPAEIKDAVDKKHEHANKALLDTYDQSNADLTDAVNKKHAHSNLALLETYTQTEVDLADAVSKKHSHSNLVLLETYTQTEVDLADAVAKKHDQNTDTALGVQSQNLDMGTHKIVNVVDPTANQDAATKKYVDDAVAAEDLWDRLSPNTLVPANANDNIDIGSGNIDTTGKVTCGELEVDGKITLENDAIIENKKNTDIDTGTETVDSFADTLGDGAVWHYVVKKGANLRAGTITVCWDVTGNTVQYNEVYTNDIGDTSDLTFAVDISGDNVRLRATAASDNWEVRVIRFLL